MTPGLCQEILQRREQIRAQTPFFPAHCVEIFSLEQQSKKTLSKILSFLWIVALPARVAIERPPVSAAKFFECFSCRRRFALSLQHHAPVCGCKRPAVMSISANRGL